VFYLVVRSRRQENEMVGLNDLQRKILTALRAERVGVLRITRVGAEVIQVSVSGQRWFGKKAVSAVMNLMVHGLITRVEGQHYELTEQGARVASRLPGSAPARPRPASNLCPRCRKRLVPGCMRCTFCGSRVAARPNVSPPDA
jgi:hypothetical protein